MSSLSTLLLALLAPLQPPQVSVTSLRDAVGSGNRARVEAMFARPADASYLFEMAGRRGGLRSLKVYMIPAPPGWDKDGPFWAVFSTRQDIEQDHDTVYGFVQTDNGLRLGKEIPEWRAQTAKLKNLRADVQLFPAESKAAISSHVDLEPWAGKGALVFRLNENYVVNRATVDGATVQLLKAGRDTVPTPVDGGFLRAGSLLILWSSKRPENVSFDYEGIVRSDGEDKVGSNAAYVTAWWTPSIARLPHKTAVRIVAPQEWHAVSEGIPATAAEAGFQPISITADTKVSTFKCDVPISYPKVIAGKYTLAAESKDAKGRTFRSYQLDPVEEARGKTDVGLMAESVAFFEKHLGEFPFPGYSCYDADTYYGIESYSHTLLNRRITTTFVTHEIGHTYFGGLTPSAYVRDSWNEGMTQYIDSVVFRNNRDGTLQNALRTLNVAVPLTQMPVAHSYGSTTYWRGAYAMKMLEAEIGQDKVLAALREIVRDRKGKDTTWPDLRPYFEKSGGKNLGWFWSQWIEKAEFPLVRIVRCDVVMRENRYRTFVTVEQTGTYAPYHLRFKVKVRGPGGVLAEQSVVLGGNRDTYQLDSDLKPTDAVIDVFPMALATVGPAVPARG